MAEGDPLADGLGGPCRRGQARLEFDIDGLLGVAHEDADRVCGPVAGEGENLLDDPVGRQVDAAGQRARLSADPQVDWLAVVPGSFDQGVQLGQPGLGLQLAVERAAAKDTEDVAHLVQGIPAGRFDGADRIKGAAGGARESPGGGLRLDHHGGDQLGDLVLKLAGEAGALFGDGQLGALLALGPQAAGGGP